MVHKNKLQSSILRVLKHWLGRQNPKFIDDSKGDDAFLSLAGILQHMSLCSAL